MFEVTVGGWFAAAHQLRLADGALEPLHGHNWRIWVTFDGRQLDGMEVLVDFTQAKPALDAVLVAMHDRNLNDLEPFQTCNPTAENVAAHIADALEVPLAKGVRIYCVAVEEAPGCVARYYPQGR